MPDTKPHDQFHGTLQQHVQEARARVETAQAEFQVARELLTKYESHLKAKPAQAKVEATSTAIVRYNKDGSISKPKGRAKGFKVVAKAPVAATKTAAPKKAEASKDKPSLAECIRQVMGNKTLNAGQVHDLLKEKKWLPLSNNVLQYIRSTLSTRPDFFTRVEGQHGKYTANQVASTKVNARVVQAKTAKAVKAAPVAVPASKSAKTATKGRASKASISEETDALLGGVGIDLNTGANPFAS